jgi:redox-regulated HSP33 family molecular chaperone
MAVKTMTATTPSTGARRGPRRPGRTIDNVAYGKLLLQTLPHVIKTEAENERMIAELERLDTCSRTLTPEEERLAELMTVLVRQFEEERYPLGEASPRLARLMSCAC